MKFIIGNFYTLTEFYGEILIFTSRTQAFCRTIYNNNNNNNNNNNKLQLGSYPVAVVILHVHKHGKKKVTREFKLGGLHERHVVATWKLGNHLSIRL